MTFLIWLANLHHQQIIAVAFQIFGWALGVPSLLLLVNLSIDLISFHSQPASDPAHPLDIHTYGLVGLLTNGAQVFGKVFEGATVVASWLMTAAAIISFIVLVFATILYFAGKGIENHAMWARVIAMLISAGIVLVSIGAMTVLPHHLIPVPCLAIAASVYSLWVLGWKFS